MRRRWAVVLLLPLVFACEPNRSKAPSVPKETARCAREHLSLSPMVEGATGSLVVYVEIAHTGAACLLEARAELRILDADGALLSVRGNPSAVPILLELPAETGLTWTWQNWCRDPIDITYRFVVDGRDAALDSRAGPRCDEPTGESILQFIQR